MSLTKTIHADDYKDLVDKLVDARKKANLTQKDVANIINCSQSYISKIENYQVRIDPIQLKNFAEIYHVDAYSLLS